MMHMREVWRPREAEDQASTSNPAVPSLATEIRRKNISYAQPIASMEMDTHLMSHSQQSETSSWTLKACEPARNVRNPAREEVSRTYVNVPSYHSSLYTFASLCFTTPSPRQHLMLEVLCFRLERLDLCFACLALQGQTKISEADAS